MGEIGDLFEFTGSPAKWGNSYPISGTDRSVGRVGEIDVLQREEERRKGEKGHVGRYHY